MTAARSTFAPSTATGATGRLASIVATLQEAAFDEDRWAAASAANPPQPLVWRLPEAQRRK